MTTKHTPGPWRVNENNRHGMPIMDSNGDGIATACWGRPADEDGANANLIAAAPDLYKELAHLVRFLEPKERDGGLDVPGLATLNGARAALAKARGETP